MASTIGHPITTARDNPGVLWVGADQDGNILDVIAALEPHQLIITHVMPHRWKERP